MQLDIWIKYLGGNWHIWYGTEILIDCDMSSITH